MQRSQQSKSMEIRKSAMELSKNIATYSKTFFSMLTTITSIISKPDTVRIEITNTLKFVIPYSNMERVK